MEFITLVEQYGLFVALVAWILYYFQKTIAEVKQENQEREMRYISIIDKLGDSFQELKNEVTLIKKKLWNKGDNE